MKRVTVFVLLAMSSMVGSLAAEVSAPNATFMTPDLSQVTSSRPASAATPLQVLEILPYRPAINASWCRSSRIIISYWGFQGVTGNDSCPVRCGVCLCEQMTNKLVGQVIYECDGSTTSWGLNCDQSAACPGSPTITEESCPDCVQEVY